MSQDGSGVFQQVDRLHPKQSDIAMYPITVDMQVRYADIDAYGHINNLAIESLHEDVRARMNAVALPGTYDPQQGQLRLVSAQNVVNFLAETLWPNTFRTAIGVGEVGTSSFVASSAVFLGDQCISLCDTVLVAVDDDGPCPLPSDTRAQLQSMMLRQDERG
ncbi:acyl-CoA thioesterase [Mycolicibacterium porcinum]|uniref:Acyl-CoA thioesterase n=1 Tax=Mycolicibacterium porcinum TaxID=39693 RepID=A0AAW5SZS2_9MYCO|nr:acyl-CoA thioesterase [Mycolicibacterium porcinum]MCV7388045.1 acyl-CoA thioesterase [Mycolicibacterium porcinum]ORB43425.1 4-hydroxybenzoyl-CoA thioesterase [Mycolicibacterium porcinum]CDO31269.1 thioesterase [Mycolicibacterium vulneris]